ncbi:cutinase family protein [Corynebacterium kalidii]|uniref:Cutinase family protein n=1 Tax=Corynebacterium kalidii TaxID=2931982 RepID=A0A9X2B164_9CORY|nr:cutinase family protein [Corynebacterium kalidii]
MRLTRRHCSTRRSGLRPLVSVAAAALALAVVGAPAAAAVGFSTGVVATPAIPRCEPDIVVIVPGGGQSMPGLPDNLPVGAYTSDLGARLEKFGTSTTRTVGYNTVPFVSMAYTDSQADGIAKTRQLIARTAAQCPSSTISLTGYSLGADVASRVAADIGHGRGPISADRFGSAAVISSPNRGADSVEGGSARGGEGVFGALPGGYGELAGRVMDICDRNDYICNSDERTRNTRSHADELTEMTAVDQAATGSSDVRGAESRSMVTEVPFGLVPGQYAHVASYAGHGGVNPAYGFLRSNF